MTTTWLRRAVRVALVGLPLMPVAVMAQDADPTRSAALWQFGLDTALMDRDVVPGDDFFSYMEGVWVKTTRIPDDKARVGYNYDLDDKVEEDIRAIAEQAVAHPDTPGAKRIAAVYSAWMDEKGIAARGLAPLQPWLAKIAAVHTRRELMELMAEPGYSSPIAIGISSDFRNPARYVVTADQGELGCPRGNITSIPARNMPPCVVPMSGISRRSSLWRAFPTGRRKRN
jgi:endothelin-converting enzyme/putative endopeptidase